MAQFADFEKKPEMVKLKDSLTSATHEPIATAFIKVLNATFDLCDAYAEDIKIDVMRVGAIKNAKSCTETLGHLCVHHLDEEKAKMADTLILGLNSTVESAKEMVTIHMQKLSKVRQDAIKPMLDDLIARAAKSTPAEYIKKFTTEIMELNWDEKVDFEAVQKAAAVKQAAALEEQKKAQMEIDPDELKDAVYKKLKEQLMEGNTGLEEEETHNYVEAYMVYDVDGSLSLSFTEIQTLLRAHGMVPTEADVQQILDAAGSKEDQTLSVADFFIGLLWIKEKMQGVDHHEELKTAFAKFDKDGSGGLKIEEFKNYMKSRGDALTDDEIENLDKMFDECDKNQDGTVDIHEFMKYLMQ